MHKKKEDHKTYRLRIDGLQICEGERLENQMDTMAAYYCIRDKIYLFYQEYQEDGSALACRLLISPEEVELKKAGNGTSLLRFRKNTRQECRYQSPMGELSLVSDTRKMNVSHQVTDRPHLQVDLEYSLYMGGSLMSDYELHIRI